MNVSALVRQTVTRSFAPPEAALVLECFARLELPLIANNGERVLLGIISLAQGDLNKFHRAVSVARVDWRDTLVAASQLPAAANQAQEP